MREINNESSDFIGGLGTRLSELTKVTFKTYGSNRKISNINSYFKTLFKLWF